MKTLSPSVSLRALSVHFPEEIRGNDWWREHHRALVERATERSLARVFSQEGEPQSIFDRKMQPYERDPFRGARWRRVAGPDEDSATLETEAARQAIAGSGWEPADVELLISTGFIPRSVGLGNAVHVAGALGLRGPAFNLESACAGPLNALRVAEALIRAGQHRRILVTTSCTYLSRALASDSLSWFMGDGAGAFTLEAGEGGARVLGSTAFHTAETRGTWFFEPQQVGDETRIVMGASPQTGPVMRASAEPHLRRATSEALADAGLRQDDIDFFVFHTPTAWFAPFAAEVLEIEPERTLSTYADYANIGPALTTANLYHAAVDRLRCGDRVLVFGPGSASSSAAAVLEWGDVALGPPPPPSPTSGS